MLQDAFLPQEKWPIFWVASFIHTWMGKNVDNFVMCSIIDILQSLAHDLSAILPLSGFAFRGRCKFCSGPVKSWKSNICQWTFTPCRDDQFVPQLMISSELMPQETEAVLLFCFWFIFGRQFIFGLFICLFFWKAEVSVFVYEVFTSKLSVGIFVICIYFFHDVHKASNSLLRLQVHLQMHVQCNWLWMHVSPFQTALVVRS